MADFNALQHFWTAGSAAFCWQNAGSGGVAPTVAFVFGCVLSSSSDSEESLLAPGFCCSDAAPGLTAVTDAGFGGCC